MSLDSKQSSTKEVRTFNTGATRSSDAGKPDYEGYLSPIVIREFGKYMTRHRHLPDGSLRASDNWQQGIPRDQYIKSMYRHFQDLHLIHRGYAAIDHQTGQPVGLYETLSAILFNTMGYFHEQLKADDAVDLDKCGTLDGVTPLPVVEGSNFHDPAVDDNYVGVIAPDSGYHVKPIPEHVTGDFEYDEVKRIAKYDGRWNTTTGVSTAKPHGTDTANCHWLVVGDTVRLIDPANRDEYIEGVELNSARRNIEIGFWVRCREDGTAA